MSAVTFTMRLCFSFVIGICLVGSASAAEDSPNKDQLQIEEAAEKFVEAFNGHKVDDLMKLFTDDAELLPLGADSHQGAEEIRAVFSAAFEANPKSQISLAMDALKFITPDVAFEDGVTINFADGETPTTRSRYSVVHVKQKGVWRMKLVRELDEELLSPYARLKDLEWMLGDWVDEDADAVVTTTCKWDDKKSFLLRSFEVKTRGDVVLKGVQRIGWDAVAKQVRSWTFDDEGGYVEGHWTQVDDRWVIKSTGYRADGLTASSTGVVTSLDDGRMEWKIEGRLLGEDPAPSVSVILVRRPPEPTAVSDK